MHGGAGLAQQRPARVTLQLLALMAYSTLMVPMTLLVCV